MPEKKPRTSENGSTTPALRTGRGPKTAAGLAAVRGNAIRHGLRAALPVAPGESVEVWEAHRDTVVADLDPSGAVEQALAERVALDLWRLTRLADYEAALIGANQEPDVLARDYEDDPDRGSHIGLIPPPTHSPTRQDVDRVQHEADMWTEKVNRARSAIRQLKRLPTLADDAPLANQDLFDEAVKYTRFKPKKLDAVMGDLWGKPLTAGTIRLLLTAKHGPEAADGRQMLEVLGAGLGFLAGQADTFRGQADDLRARYDRALERRRVVAGLPGQADLDRIAKYEAHLRRGLDKSLEQLAKLQERRRPAPGRIVPASVVRDESHKDKLIGKNGASDPDGHPQPLPRQRALPAPTSR